MVNETEGLVSGALGTIVPDYRTKTIILGCLENKLEPILLEGLCPVIRPVDRTALTYIYRDVVVQIFLFQHPECVNDILLAVIRVLLPVSSGMAPFSIGGILAQPLDTLSEKWPSISVIVPLVVPFSTTLAPMTGPT